VHPRYTELRVGSLSNVRVALDPCVSVLALTTDALGRQRGAAGEWRSLILSALSPGRARAVLPIVTPRYSVTPDCVTPQNPALKIPVPDQVAWLHSIPEDELLGDFGAAFDETRRTGKARCDGRGPGCTHTPPPSTRPGPPGGHRAERHHLPLRPPGRGRAGAAPEAGPRGLGLADQPGC
jgi:hypothetical protein